VVVPYLNERMLYRFQWGYRKDGRTLVGYQEWAKDELRPVLKRIFDIAIGDEILVRQAAYGYRPRATEMILFDVDGQKELTRFSFPRQNKAGGLCIADFFRDVSSNERDVIALRVVTMGGRASEAARE
jgi:5-methyltetrahydrofolate--homocysteine methyltransferase